jgi:TolA-binding protein
MLKPKKRVTRQQIKEDKLIAFTAKASDFYDRNSRNILAGAGIIVVLAVVIAFFINNRAQAEKAATFDLTLAKIEIGQQNYDTAAQKLSQVIETYSGTRAAGDAQFFLGNVHLSMQDWSGARTAFQQFLDRYGKDPQFTAAAIAGLGFADEHEEKFLDAAEHYLEAADSYPNEYNAPQYLLDAGRCFAFAGEIPKAHDAFRLIVERYPESAQKQKAEDELNRW